MERITGRNVCSYNGYSSNAYNSVERYRSPVSGSSATIVLPSFSGNLARRAAAATAAPEEMPTSNPSYFASSRPYGWHHHWIPAALRLSRHCYSSSAQIPHRYLVFYGDRAFRRKVQENLRAPQPQSLPSGYWLSSCAHLRSPCLPYLHLPRKHRPTVRITPDSCPVIRSCIAGLAGLSNCCKISEPGLAPQFFGTGYGAFHTVGTRVSTSSAPRAFKRLRRSRLIVSGIVSISL